MTYTPNLDLTPVFFAFSGHRDEMDGRQWVKFCADVELFDEYFTAIDADLIFTRVKPPRRRKIDFAEFEAALLEVGARKCVPSAEVLGKVRQAGGPVFRTVVPTAPPRGPQRFFYDKTTYTGAHKRGGPTTVDAGRGGLIDDISHLCDRSRADKRGVKEYDSVVSRSTSSYIDPSTNGVGSKLASDPHVSPRSGSLSMSFSMNMSGGRRGSSSVDTPTTRGMPSPSAWNASTALESPRTPVWPPRVSLANSSSAGTLRGRGPSTPQKLSFTPKPREDKGVPMRGPARFFYDKSTYTGVHANAGEDTAMRPVAHGAVQRSSSSRGLSVGRSPQSISDSGRRPVVRPLREVDASLDLCSP